MKNWIHKWDGNIDLTSQSIVIEEMHQELNQSLDYLDSLKQILQEWNYDVINKHFDKIMLKLLDSDIWNTTLLKDFIKFKW
jgi:hypothetical protein